MTQLIQEKINQKRAEINAISQTLEYADGQAFYRDRQKIRQLDNEVINLQRQLDGKNHTVRDITATREQIAAIQAAEKQRKQQEASAYALALAKEKQALIASKIRSRKARVATFGNTRRYYLKECTYTQSQQLKHEQGSDLRWDPFVQRMYMSVYTYGSQLYAPGGMIADFMLSARDNIQMTDLSDKIKYELQNLPEHKRELTLEYHKTGSPKFWNSK